MRLAALALVALLQLAAGQITGTTSTVDSAATTTNGASDTTATANATGAAATASANTTTADPITKTIAVGLGGHVFSPSVVQLSPSNFVEFQFYPTNHSVIRAEYKFPCIPYEMTGVDKVGFDSGFKIVDAILPDPPKFTLRINDTDPIFFYCGAPGSCIDWQMVGVINPNASVSLDVQKEYAANSSFMLLPGEDWPDEAETPFTTSSTTSAPTASSTTGSSAGSTSTSGATESHGHGLSTGAIAGIAIGAAAVAIAGAALLFFCGRKSRRNNQNAAGPSQPAMAPAPPAYVPPGGFDYRSSMQPSVMSPVMNKHMSGISTAPVPITDAFGNPTGQYAQPQYPGAYQQPGYPPHMTPQQPYGWPGSPAQDIFGQAATPLGHENQPLVAGSELHSQRASSPGSTGAAPQPQSGGIEGFLQRQNRMSPAPEHELHQQQTTPLMSHQRQTSASGPFEMSANR